MIIIILREWERERLREREWKREREREFSERRGLLKKNNHNYPGREREWKRERERELSEMRGLLKHHNYPERERERVREREREIWQWMRRGLSWRSPRRGGRIHEKQTTLSIAMLDYMNVGTMKARLPRHVLVCAWLARDRFVPTLFYEGYAHRAPRKISLISEGLPEFSSMQSL